jgi:hypothetical protein
MCLVHAESKEIADRQTSLKPQVDVRHSPHSRGVGMEESSFLEAIARQIT